MTAGQSEALPGPSLPTPNVRELVAARGLCSGCGVCAGVAPDECLEMVLTPAGEYAPVVAECTGCGLCSHVCPLNPARESLADGWPLGRVLRSLVGHSLVPEERGRGSSGGLATRVLKALLERKLVDAVIAVVPTGQPDRLFEPAILRTADEIGRAAGSKYYPVEFSRVLREVHATDGRYAVIGLPCVVTALRQACRRCGWAADRIRYMLGLVCGHGVSTHHTKALAWLSGLRGTKPVSVRYRLKEDTKAAHDYRFQAVSAEGVTGEPLPFTGGWVSPLWCDELLSLGGCLACIDLFALDADVTFMDAWLPEHVADTRGTSLVLVRNPTLASVVDGEVERGRVALSPVSEEDVLRSQAGALARKQTVVLVSSQSGGRPYTLPLDVRYRRARAHLLKWVLRDDWWGEQLGLWALRAYLSLLPMLAKALWPLRKARSALARLTRRSSRRLGTKTGGTERAS